MTPKSQSSFVTLTATVSDLAPTDTTKITDAFKIFYFLSHLPVVICNLHLIILSCVVRTEERCCFTFADLLIITTLKMIKDFTFFYFHAVIVYA